MNTSWWKDWKPILLCISLLLANMGVSYYLLHRAQAITVRIQPAMVVVPPGARHLFTARITGGSTSRIRWMVVEPDGGSITPHGRYSAPRTPGVYHVLVSATSWTKYGVATIVVQPPAMTGKTDIKPTPQHGARQGQYISIPHRNEGKE